MTELETTRDGVLPTPGMILYTSLLTFQYRVVAVWDNGEVLARCWSCDEKGVWHQNKYDELIRHDVCYADREEAVAAWHATFAETDGEQSPELTAEMMQSKEAPHDAQ